MVRLAERYPQYGFERHVGYGTPEHKAALRVHGPCELHRRSFAPCSQLALDLGLDLDP
jgi:ribonuclease HII